MRPRWTTALLPAKVRRLQTGLAASWNWTPSTSLHGSPPPRRRGSFAVLYAEASVSADALKELAVSDMEVLHCTQRSTVYRATLHDRRVVVKAVDTASSVGLRSAHAEVALLQRLQSPHIIRMIAALRIGTHFMIVLEEASLGSVRSVLKSTGTMRMTESVAVRVVLRGLVNATAFMHAQSVVHQDLKCDNLLLMHDWTVRVADLGLSFDPSMPLSPHGASATGGTRGYMPPEVVFQRKPATYAADVWAIGVIAYELLTGFKPIAFAGPIAFPNGTSPDARDFVCACLRRHPGQRPTAAELTRHPWIVSQGI